VTANTRRYFERNRAFLNEYLKAHPCVDCGESDLAVLDFDHVNGKVMEISRLVLYASVRRIVEEIERCEVRCANCHARRTAKQFGWRKEREDAVASLSPLWA
jgi:hypothetical protein